jgi:hypothetical protein
MDAKIESGDKNAGFFQISPLILIVATLPWSIFSNSIAIIIFLTYNLYRVLTKKISIKFDLILFFFWGLFFLSGLGLFYTSDLINGIKEFEKHLVFFIFPIFLLSLSQKLIYNLVSVFCISFSFNFLWFLISLNFNFSSLENFQSLPIHYPYFGIYSAFCGVFFLYRIVSDFDYWKLRFVPIYFFFLWLVLVSSSRNAQIYFFLTSYFLILSSFKNKKGVLLAIPIIVISSIFLVMNLPRFDKFTDALNVKELSWLCSIESLDSSKKWLLGVGTGSAQDSLQECYRSHNSWFMQFKYNSHNQYLTFLLTNGVFSFMLFFVMILYYLFLSLKNKNYLLFILVFSLSISSISESVLLVNKGIIFYTFWLCIFSRAKNLESIRLNVYN